MHLKMDSAEPKARAGRLTQIRMNDQKTYKIIGAAVEAYKGPYFNSFTSLFFHCNILSITLIIKVF
jgi:hypothetical protein